MLHGGTAPFDISVHNDIYILAFYVSHYQIHPIYIFDGKYQLQLKGISHMNKGKNTGRNILPSLVFFMLDLNIQLTTNDGNRLLQKIIYSKHPLRGKVKLCSNRGEIKNPNYFILQNVNSTELNISNIKLHSVFFLL